MSDPKGLTVARAYHRAWSTRTFDDLDRYVGDDLRVEVPINAYGGKRDFLDAVRRTAQMATRVTVLSELGSEDEALLLYDMTLPIGLLRVAEHFQIKDGRIRQLRQIHDTATLRAAGFGAGQAG
jgi:hypothetical protein